MKNTIQICPKHTGNAWLAIGIAIGAGFGAATGNMGECVGFGVAIGVFLRAVWGKKANDKQT